MVRFKRLAAAAVLCLIAAPLFSAETIAYVYRASLLAIGEDNGLAGDLSPILPSPGFAVSLPLLPLLRFEPGVDGYVTYYGYSDSLDRAVPVALENRSALVYGLVLNLPIEFAFSIANVAGFHLSGGLTSDLRLVFAADGLEGDDLADAEEEAAKTASYFWGGARWLFANGAFGFDFPVAGIYTLGVEGRIWYPLYRFWTGEELPFLENLRVSIGLRLVMF